LSLYKQVFEESSIASSVQTTKIDPTPIGIYQFPVSVLLQEQQIPVKPYSRLLGHIWWRLMHKFNVLLVITGEPGIGKSDYALQIALHIDRNFTSAQVLADSGKVFKLIRVLPLGSVIVLDEAAVEFGNVDWMTNFSKMFRIVGITDRVFQKVIILCLPNLNMLDVNQRRLLTGILHVYYRGRAEFSKPEGNRTGEVIAKPYFVCDAQPLPEDHWLRGEYNIMMQDFKAQAVRNAEIDATLMHARKSYFDKNRFGDMSTTDNSANMQGPKYEDDLDDGIHVKFKPDEIRKVPKYERTS